MPMIRKITLLALLLIIAGAVSAQDSGGQVCIRAFEDRNTNGTADPGEPRITSGISASLINEEGIIVETAFMEDAQTAASGTLCFYRLPAGQYSIRVNSARYEATTAESFVTFVSETGTPQVFEYGGRVINIPLPANQPDAAFGLSESRTQNIVSRIAVSAIAAGLVIAVLAVAGAVIYFLFLRKPGQPAPAPAYSTWTPPEGENRPAVPPSYSNEETGGFKAIESEEEFAPFDEVPPRYTPGRREEDDFSFEDNPEDTSGTDDTDAPFRPPQ